MFFSVLTIIVCVDVEYNVLQNEQSVKNSFLLNNFYQHVYAVYTAAPALRTHPANVTNKLPVIFHSGIVRSETISQAFNCLWCLWLFPFFCSFSITFFTAGDFIPSSVVHLFKFLYFPLQCIQKALFCFSYACLHSSHSHPSPYFSSTPSAMKIK